jgi:hypothetical protein
MVVSVLGQGRSARLTRDSSRPAHRCKGRGHSEAEQREVKQEVSGRKARDEDGRDSSIPPPNDDGHRCAQTTATATTSLLTSHFTAYFDRAELAVTSSTRPRSRSHLPASPPPFLRRAVLHVLAMAATPQIHLSGAADTPSFTVEVPVSTQSHVRLHRS